MNIPMLALCFAAWAGSQTLPVGQTRRFDFEKPDDAFQITEPGTIRENAIGASKSLVAECRPGGQEWNEVFHSQPGLLSPESIIRIRFRADFRSEAPKARAYLLVRSLANAKDQLIWVDITNRETADFDLSLITRKTQDYRIIAGVFREGTLRLDDLVLESTPASAITSTVLPSPGRSFQSPGNTQYFVDSVTGDDANPGTSATRPWRSLSRVNATVFSPGDILHLASGSAWQGVLAPGGEGSAAKPITLRVSGKGPRPIIMAREEDQAALYLSNQSHWEISGLELMNKGKLSEMLGSLRYGALILARDAGVVRHVVLSNLYVHDVNASVIKDSGRAGWGILVKANGKGTWHEDVRITHCALERCDRNGIQVANGSYLDRANFTPSLGVVIAHNRLRDIGGDGIVPIGCRGALVEYNTVSDCHIRAGKFPGQYSAGIWPWSCDDTLLQYNEAYGTHFTTDGQGFDCDYNCSNTVFQYNYSHDNEGGFMLICNNGEPAGYNRGNLGSIVRFNISQNDGERIFAFGGPCDGTRIHNNTIWMGNPKLKWAVKFGSWGGWARDSLFYNNIFYDAVGATFDLGESKDTVFLRNLYFGKVTALPADERKLTADPLFLDGGKGGLGRDSLGGYRLAKGSPARGIGIALSNWSGNDFWGKPVDAARPPLGAGE